MNPNNYKITKFAIKQDNLKLLKYVLKEDNLSEEQLSECLILAKGKTDIYQELTKLIVDSSEEKSEEKSEKERLICVDEKNKFFARDNSELMLAINDLSKGEVSKIKEELWTTEQVDHANSQGWTVIHYFIYSKNYYPNLFKKALKLTNMLPNCITYFLTSVIMWKNSSISDFHKFQLFWYAAKEKNLTELAEKECLLKFIYEKRNHEDKDKFLKFLLLDTDYNVQYEDKIFIDGIVKGSLKLDKDASKKIVEKLLKQPGYKPNFWNFLRDDWWNDCDEEDKKTLLESNKFFLSKVDFQGLIAEGYNDFISDFVKYCPQNIQLVKPTEKKKTFDSWNELIKEYFEYKFFDPFSADGDVYRTVKLKKDLGGFKNGKKFDYLTIFYDRNMIQLTSENTFNGKPIDYVIKMCNQISFKNT